MLSLPKRAGIAKQGVSGLALKLTCQRHVSQVFPTTTFGRHRSIGYGFHKNKSIDQYRIRSNESNDDRSALSRQLSKDELIVVSSALGLSLLTAIGIIAIPGYLEQSDGYYFDSGFSSGDMVGSLLWATSYYFCSPWQLLLLFLGRIDTERPSDWLMRVMGRVMGYDVDGLGYEPPAVLKIAAVAMAILWGVLTASILEISFGDGSWSVSTGIGACFAAFVYEVGRPKRLSSEEAELLEKQWVDFKTFADTALSPTGRCHETEIMREFRKRFGKYRSEENLSDARIRDMISNWSSDTKRSRNGYYRNISIKSSIDQI